MAGYQDLLDLVNEREIDAENRRRLRAMLVKIGGQPAETRALVASLMQSNAGIETTRDLLHWVELISGDIGREVDAFRETTNFVLTPIVAAGFAAPVAAIAAVARIGSGGVLLVAIGGMVAAGGSIRGMIHLRRQRNLVEQDLSAIVALRSQLQGCERDLLRREER